MSDHPPEVPPEILASINEASELIASLAPETVHVMTDIETWGNGNKALVVSLGAVKFTRDAILDRFHVGIDPRSAQALGLDIDADTILWWFDKERDEARHSWLALEKVDLASALMGFDLWCKGGQPAQAIWGNGSTFDNVILRSACAAAGIEYPVPFWGDQCYRTMKYRAPDVKLVREGVHHNALDDAMSQAKHLQAIVAHLGCDL
jgi:hypothetical protein